MKLKVVLVLLELVASATVVSQHLWFTSTFESVTESDLTNVVLQVSITELSFSVWVKFDVLPSASAQTVCTVNLGISDSIIIAKQVSPYQVSATNISSTSRSLSSTGASSAFQWEFLAVSAKGGSLLLCSSLFRSTSSCSSSVQQIPFNYSNLDLHITAGSATSGFLGEIFDIQLHAAYLSQTAIEAFLASYQCNSKCATCWGPTISSCDEFLSLILDSEQPSLPREDTLAVQSTSSRFQGKSFTNLDNLSVTFWFKPYSAPTDSYPSLFRISQSSCNACIVNTSTIGCRMLYLELQNSATQITLQHEKAVHDSSCNVWNASNFVSNK